MPDNKMFNDKFRESMFKDVNRLSQRVNRDLAGLFQNPMPLTPDLLNQFYNGLESIISDLKEVDSKVKSELASGNLVDFSSSDKLY